MPEFFEYEFWDGRLHNIIAFFTILISTFVLARVVRVLLDKFFKNSSEIIHVDLSKYKILKRLIITAIYVVGIGLAIYSIPTLRSLSLSIFAGAGILAAVIGFASQKAFSNIISGIFIVIFRPFRVDDRIQVGQNIGVVEDITLRHTVIKNAENKRIVIPNSIVSDETVINFTLVDEKICRLLDLGISYGSDIKKARAIIQAEVKKHPLWIDNRTPEQIKANENPVPVRVINWGESSINLRVWVWTKDPIDAFIIGCDLYESVKERFDAEGIEIPFPHRTLIYKNTPEKQR